MFTNIYAEGLAYAGQDSFEEVEITALFLEVSRSYGLYTSRAKIYAEDDDKSSSGDGFFKKIINFIRNLLKKIMDFFRKLIKKVVELVSRPFGVKLKSAEAAGGGGSSGSTTTRTSSSETASTPENVVKGIEGNHTEINNVIKALIKYASGTLGTPKAQDRNYFSGIEVDNLSVSTKADKNTIFNTQAIDTIYRSNDVEDIFTKIAGLIRILESLYGGIGSLYERDKSAIIDSHDLIDSISNGHVKFKIHSNFDMSVDSFISPDKAINDMNHLYQSFLAAQRIMCGSFSSLNNCIDGMNTISNKQADDATKTREFIGTIKGLYTNKTAIANDDKIASTISQDNTFNIFGLPPKEAILVYRYSMIASGGQSLINSVGVENILQHISKRTNMRYLNIQTISKYNKMLEKDVISKDTIKRLFKKVTIDKSKNIKAGISSITFNGYQDDPYSNISDVIDEVEELCERMNKENEDTKKTGVDNFNDKINKVNSSDSSIKEFLNVSASSVRQLSVNITKFTDVLKFTANTYQSLQYVPIVCAYTNLAYWVIDGISAHLHTLLEFKKQPKFTELFSTNDDKARFDNEIEDIKSSIVNAMKSAFGAQKES